MTVPVDNYHVTGLVTSAAFRRMWALERLKAERDALNKRIEAMERKP